MIKVRNLFLNVERHRKASFRDHLAMVGEIQYKKNVEEPALQVDNN